MNLNIWDIIILILVAVILAGAFFLARGRKKNGCCGSGGCGGSCSGCSGSDGKKDY